MEFQKLLDIFVKEIAKKGPKINCKTTIIYGYQQEKQSRLKATLWKFKSQTSTNI